MNTKNLLYGVLLLIGAAVGIYCLLTKEFKAYYIVGSLIFLMAGIGFLKRVKE